MKYFHTTLKAMKYEWQWENNCIYSPSVIYNGDGSHGGGEEEWAPVC